MDELVRVNALFVVAAPVVYEDEGKVVARYSPRYGTYRVTERNRDFVAGLVAAGKAAVVGVTRPVVANAARTGEAI